MNDELKAIVLLNGLQQYDARLIEKMEASGVAADSLWRDGDALWNALGISERCRKILSDMIAGDWAEREMERCEKNGVRAITCLDALYPQALLDLKDPPLMLYVRGERFNIPSKSVGVVGTRRCTQYGRRIAHDFCRSCAASSWCVVSGGARGIDGAAHEGALDGQGTTFAIFGNGIDVTFPLEHAELFLRIESSGALITEYPFGARGEAWRFPRRNRLIAALSQRMLVVEAPEKSGAMITARLALDIGREVWAVPGRIDEESCLGSNRLIFDGAMPMIDIECFFGPSYQQGMLFKQEDGGEDPQAPKVKLTEVEKIVLALISSQRDRTVDNLAGEAKMSAAEILKTVSLLTLRGLVRQSGPGRYRACED